MLFSTHHMYVANLYNALRILYVYPFLSSQKTLVGYTILIHLERNSQQFHFHKVGDRVYLGDKVPDGFFDSLSQLKSIDQDKLESSASFQDFKEDYYNILEVCESGQPIPAISEMKAHDLLKRIKPDVRDLYSITANHYLHAGTSGIKHFCLLLNTFIEDISFLTITEVNQVYATILFKGHKKDKFSARSYRSISICPLIPKALDLYIRDLNLPAWNDDQAETQFQGEGSSHELAALLLTETIQHSLFNLKEPVFVIYLDAKSAFDVILRQLLVALMGSLF